MGPVDELERGLLHPPPVGQSADVPLPSEVARRWAVALDLRPGNASGPRATALARVVGVWARERGWTEPGSRDVGRGLAWAGLWRRRVLATGPRLPLLHPADAARLWQMVRQAWAPECAPGDPRARPPPRRKRKKRPNRLTAPRPAARPFHEEVAQLRSRAAPLVDSQGRVWPSPAVAAAHLGGYVKSLDNARRFLAAALSAPVVDSAALRAALRKGASWKGVLWRHLTPAEVRAVPPTHLTGEPLPAFAWGLTCPRCGGCGAS